MEKKGNIALVDQALVTQNTKEKSVASALKRNRENMKNGDKIEKYFNNKPNNNMFLYHKKRADMQGDTLYPLNTLKEIHPEISTEIIKKYDGREWLLNTRIPRLDCLWNDVIHLTAVHPSKMYDTLLEAGQELKDFKWFKIPIESLDPDKMIVYLQKGHMVGGKTLLDEDFSDFDINKMSEYEVIGDRTKEYFKRRIQNNESVLMFHMVPHILYKGNIDTKGMEIIPTIPRE